MSNLINILDGGTDYEEDGLAVQLDEPLRPGGGKKEEEETFIVIGGGRVRLNCKRS